jgi:hypothetical protein
VPKKDLLYISLRHNVHNVKKLSFLEILINSRKICNEFVVRNNDINNNENQEKKFNCSRNFIVKLLMEHLGLNSGIASQVFNILHFSDRNFNLVIEGVEQKIIKAINNLVVSSYSKIVNEQKTFEALQKMITTNSVKSFSNYCLKVRGEIFLMDELFKLNIPKNEPITNYSQLKLKCPILVNEIKNGFYDSILIQVMRKKIKVLPNIIKTNFINEIENKLSLSKNNNQLNNDNVLNLDGIDENNYKVFKNESSKIQMFNYSNNYISRLFHNDSISNRKKLGEFQFFIF